MSRNSFEVIGKFIFEFRYDTLVSFFDWKGSLAEHLIDKYDFKGFRVLEDRIDLTDPEHQKYTQFISLQKAGIAIENESNFDEFTKYVRAFIDNLYNFSKFKPKNIVRVGTRAMLFTHKRSSSFENVKSSFETTFIAKNEEFDKKFPDELIDIGLPMNFKTDEHFYNISWGPMQQNQAIGLFNNKTIYFNKDMSIIRDFPNNGFFFDIDVFKKDLGEINSEKLIEHVEKNIKFAEKSYKNALDLIFK